MPRSRGIISPPRQGDSRLNSLDKSYFPKSALIGAGILIVGTIVGVAHHQLTKPAVPSMEEGGVTVVKSRLLRFVDLGDGVSAYGGHVRVFDESTGAEMSSLRDREGFVRAVLNSLSFERRRSNVISAPPVYELVYWSNGKITLKDLATGVRIDVSLFSADNKAVFMRFFAPVESPS